METQNEGSNKQKRKRLTLEEQIANAEKEAQAKLNRVEELRKKLEESQAKYKMELYSKIGEQVIDKLEGLSLPSTSNDIDIVYKKFVDIFNSDIRPEHLKEQYRKQ